MSTRSRTHALALALFIAAAGAGAAMAQTAYLVRDIDAHDHRLDRFFNPDRFFAAGTKVLFTALQKGSDSALWASDGTAGGTELLAYGCPGFCQGELSALATTGPISFFVLHATAGGPPYSQLWRSDGTRSGTFQLTPDAPRLQEIRSHTLLGGTLYFSACEDSLSGPCWLGRSDGSREGTALIFQRPEIRDVVGLRGKIFFSAGDGGAGGALWTSDGTAGGTRAVAALPSQAFCLTATTERLFFCPAEQIWTSDGTAAGTRRLTDFHRPLSAGFQTFGERIYFLGDDGAGGDEIWTSDGTLAGTHAVTRFRSKIFFPATSDDGPFFDEQALGDRLIFTAGDGGLPVKIWKTDGTPASAAPVSDVEVTPGDLAPVGGRIVFHGRDAAHGEGLWATDGTAKGTIPLLVSPPGPEHLDLFGPFPIPGVEGFFFASGPGGVTIWKTDGTAAGTRRFTDVQFFKATTFTVLAGKLFLSATIDRSLFGGVDLWVSDGRAGGTHALTDVHGITGDSSPRNLAALGDSLFFRATQLDAAGASLAIWRSDGTAPGTEAATPRSDYSPIDSPLVAAGGRMFYWHGDGSGGAELWSAAGSSPATELTRFGTISQLPPPSLAPLGGRAFFALPDGGGQVWASDGTPAGTAVAFTVPGAAISGLETAGQALYFLATHEGSHAEVWTSDGTQHGTRRISDAPGLEPFGDPLFTAIGPLVFFRTGSGLWRTDGSAAGTIQLDDTFGNDLLGFAALGGSLYYFASDPGGGVNELRRSDGTRAGTVAVQQFAISDDLGRAGWEPELVTAGDRLFLAVDDRTHGRELWTSDGTPAGTALVRDISPGGSSWPHALTAVGGKVFFSADDGLHGSELWASDGTPAGTRLVADIAPEGLSSDPGSLTAAGDRLYFAADDGLHGRELWALPLAGPTLCQPSPARLCLGAGRFQVEAEWRDFQGLRGSGTAVPLTGDTGYFWFFDPANVEAVTKILDGRPVNQAFWVFYGALSSVEYWLTVTDAETGLSRRYFNPAGQLASVGDTHGFGPLGAFDSQRAASPPEEARSFSPTLASARTDPRAATGSCTAGPGRLCLNGGRFAVTAAWKDFQGHTGNGTAVPLTGDTGYFWFFNPANVEVVTKVLDGRAVNDKFWLFYGALSSVEYTLTVTDTQTGAMKMYKNASGKLASVADTAAF